jgi:hypothetical protein
MGCWPPIGWIIWREFDINITLKRHFLRMNKKDVLGLRPAAWNVQKMESMPHGFPVSEMLKIRHSTGQGQGVVFGIVPII